LVAAWFAGFAGVRRGVCRATGAGFSGRAWSTCREPAERRRGGRGTIAKNAESRRVACDRRCSCHCRLEGGRGACGRRCSWHCQLEGSAAVEHGVCGASGAGFVGRRGARAESRQRGGGAGTGRPQRTQRVVVEHAAAGAAAIAGLRAGARFAGSAAVEHGVCGASGAGFAGRALEARAESRQRGGGACVESSGRHCRLEVGRGVCAEGALRLQRAQRVGAASAGHAQRTERRRRAIYANVLIVSRDIGPQILPSPPCCPAW
jgi:hypothetical protein